MPPICRALLCCAVVACALPVLCVCFACAVRVRVRVIHLVYFFFVCRARWDRTGPDRIRCDGLGYGAILSLDACRPPVCFLRGVVWRGVAWRGVAWCGVVWCGVVWCGVAWCVVTWRGVVWCDVPWRGVVWCGVAWRGVVRRGVAWCGVVCGVFALRTHPFREQSCDALCNALTCLLCASVYS